METLADKVKEAEERAEANDQSSEMRERVEKLEEDLCTKQEEVESVKATNQKLSAEITLLKKKIAVWEAGEKGKEPLKLPGVTKTAEREKPVPKQRAAAKKVIKRVAAKSKPRKKCRHVGSTELGSARNCR